MVNPKPRLATTPRRRARFDPFSHETQSRLRSQCKVGGHVTTPALNLSVATASVCTLRPEQLRQVLGRSLGAGVSTRQLTWMRFSRRQVCTSLLFRSVESKETGSRVVLTTPCAKPVLTPKGSTARRYGSSTVSRNLSRNLFPSTHATFRARLKQRQASFARSWHAISYALARRSVSLV